MPHHRLLVGGALVLIGLAGLVWLDLWLDDRWSRQYLEREEMTVRPRYRQPEWAVG